MIFNILLSAIILMFSVVVHAEALLKPHTFTATQMLSATKVNKNFQALSDGISTLESKLDPLDIETGSWLRIPHTFVGGTRAKASEIRGNYSAVASEINTLRRRVDALDSTPFEWHGVPHTIAVGEPATETVLNENFDALFAELNALQDRITAIASKRESVADAFEPDNTMDNAQVIVVDDEPQGHTIHRVGDQDWVQFLAVSGERYEIRVDQVGTLLDPVLELYDPEGHLVPDINGDEGRAGEKEGVSWRASVDGIHFILVKPFHDDQYGEASRYELRIFRPEAAFIGFVSGKVLDQTTQAPIVLARIRTDGRGSALSTSEGNYLMAHRAGNYQATVTAEGYHPFSGQIVVSELAITTFNISMAPDIPNQMPTASLTVSPSSGNTNTSFQFDASSSSDPEDATSQLQARWDWDGDNNWDTVYSSNKTLSHTFGSANTYTVQVQVKDSGGLTKITSHQVEVKTNQVPTASFTVSPSSGETGTSFQFDASGSSDPEDSSNLLQVRWDWDGDSNWDTVYATTKTASRTFTVANIYTVQAQVKDSGGLTKITSRQVTVNTPNQAPTISFMSITYQTTNTNTPTSANSFTINDAETAAGDLLLTGNSSNTSLVPNANIVFGGSGISRTVTVTPVSGRSGSTTITVNVSDGEDTASKSYTVTVLVPNQAPTASFTVSSSSGDTDTSFQFNASGSSDPEDVTSVLQVRWDWDSDSNWDTGYSTTKTVPHSFPSSGDYTVKMQVKDSKGLTGTTSHQVTASAANRSPTAVFTVNRLSGDTSTNFQFNASSSSDLEDATSVLQVRWDWDNDSNWDTGYATTKTVSHSFPSSGDYTVKMQVKDSKGLTNTTSHLVTVSPKSVPSVGDTYTGDTYTNSLGMTFKKIPSGTFMMGCEGEDGASGYSCESNEAPKHSVTISKAFYMQTTEVTQGQWKAVMGSNPSDFSSCGDTCPVEMVSWDDIQTFLSTLNGLGQGTYRLPTEAEWEYSARAGTTTAYSFGDNSSQLEDYGWYLENSQVSYSGSYSGKGTHPVATKLPNPWGLYDMHGNVWEWVQDIYDSSAYSSHSASDPIYEKSGSGHVLRGGSWIYSAGRPRSAFRSPWSPSLRIVSLGFRVVSAPPGL